MRRGEVQKLICRTCRKKMYVLPWQIRKSPNLKFCSVKCRNLGHRNRIKKVCKICGQTFDVRICEQKFRSTCSKECSAKYRSKKARERVVTWGDKISHARKGHPIRRTHITPEYRERMRQLAIVHGFGKNLKGIRLTPEHREKMRQAHSGRSHNGWKLSETARRNISEGHRGEKSVLWKGGITPVNALIRATVEYKIWKEEVFKRDRYTCVLCGESGVKFHADHIKPFALFPELRFEVSNGRTLCIPCHRKTPTYLKGSRGLIKEI